MLWEPPTLTILCLGFVSTWWFLGRRSATPRTTRAIAALTGFVVLVDCRALALCLCKSLYHVVANAAPLEQLNMVLTLGAVLWLLHRSWQTVRKPVSDLVDVLGFDIPEAPEVCLSGIGSESATLSWDKPNRPAQRFSVQVNGVHVGDSPADDTTVTVTGLRPNHFYNVRVVAVGPNNFRVGSRFIRLRTFGKDGKPQLGGSRLPTSFVDPGHLCDQGGDESGKSDKPMSSSSPVASAASALDANATAPSRGPAVAIQVRPRNTANRQNSPSATTSTRLPASAGPEMSMDELDGKIVGIRKQISYIAGLNAKEKDEFQQQEEGLTKERDRKKQAHKEREEEKTRLKAIARTTTEQMRAADKERAKKEQQLKDKEEYMAKIQDSIARLEHGVEEMKIKRQGFETQLAELAQLRDRDLRKLDDEIAELQESCTKLEAELKEKGKQLQDLKVTKEQRSVEDKQKLQEDLVIQREFQAQVRQVSVRVDLEIHEGRVMEREISELAEQLNQHRAGLGLYAQSGSSSMNPMPMVQPSHLGHGSSPVLNPSTHLPDRISSAEPNSQGTTGFSEANFSTGLLMTADGTNEANLEAELKTVVGGPLSPSAQTLLPSNIFEESEDTDMMRPPLPDSVTAGEESPRTPVSPNMPFNAFPSPNSSVHNLSSPQYAETGDGNSPNVAPPPAVPLASTTSGHMISSILSSLQRSRGAKTSDDGGPPIGILRPGQSQSFPNGTGENEVMGSRRRNNWTNWMSCSRAGQGSTPSEASIATSEPSSALRLNPFNDSPPLVIPSVRDAEIGRPISTASTDLPRPSTDSGSIWGAPGDALGLGKHRMWTVGEAPWPSRSGSRRPSYQGSIHMTTTLASAEDAILNRNDLLNPETLPSQVGVIGSRLPGASRLMNQRLNPTAPTFMAHLRRKDKDRARDREKEEKGKGKEGIVPSIDLPPSLDDSPSDSRASRDTPSIHTQVSVSESRESLQLDSTVSTAAPDINPALASNLKDPENVVRKLFRKGSSSKFSLSSRLGKDSGLFKKGTGSATNPGKNTSAEHRWSVGDLDLSEDVAVLGRSYDSMASSSPSIGPPRSKEGREGGRIGSWRFSMSSIKKKGKDAPVKEQESLETDRAADED